VALRSKKRLALHHLGTKLQTDAQLTELPMLANMAIQVGTVGRLAPQEESKQDIEGRWCSSSCTRAMLPRGCCGHTCVTQQGCLMAEQEVLLPTCGSA
jgi:hypothetical protein